MFQQIWPSVLANPDSPASQTKMAKSLAEIDKIAFSTTLRKTTWERSRIATMNAESIYKIKNDHPKNLLTIGSPGLVSELTKLGLIDEYYFSVQTLIAGSGNSRLFGGMSLAEKQPLRFLDSRSLASGVQILHYGKP